jgi:peroxiredoxin (alkyl hydroperoxide reductase subunit C)
MTPDAPLEIGRPAPEFRLRGPGGQAYTLSEYRGSRNVLLAFYPLAFSPVCAHQLPEIQRALAHFRAHDTEVFGVSVDSWYANQEFARRLGLSFALLSDFHRVTCAEYGVLLPERGYSNRALFLVDKQGILAWREIAPSPSDIPSTANALAAVERLGAG